MSESKLNSILLMTIAIQLSIVGLVLDDGSLFLLFFLGILITAFVVFRELVRLKEIVETA